MESEIDTSIIIHLVGAHHGMILSPAEISVWDVAREAWISTATNFRLEFDWGKPSITAFIEELVTTEGERIRAKGNQMISEQDAYSPEYAEWLKGPKAEPFEGEVFNLKTFRYLVEDVEVE